ncbi:MAG: tRNA dihydrouridine synthase DusB [Eubacterium sp.]|nr:tRNA dihydrouridine synthase DusB [Eubacterium sp.]
MKLKSIGDLTPENPFFLAPMAGITDAPARRIARHAGASLTYTEMVSAKALYYDDKKTAKLLDSYPDECPYAIQIFGHEPDIMAIAARKLRGRTNSLIDINMGCPVPKIVKNGEGSALMKDPGLVREIVGAVSEAARKPVTVKIRAGFSENSRNAVEVARAAEEGGVAAVAVHGRTREQYYSGRADWSVIADVRQAVSIPVIGNGDVVDVDSAVRMFDETGCDFIMVARAARGNPWIFRDLKALWEGEPSPGPASIDERIGMLLRELSELTELKGEYTAVREMRSITGWYLKGVPGAVSVRREINRITDPDSMIELLCGLRNGGTGSS